jgi:opacity protein-like surface antigen
MKKLSLVFIILLYVFNAHAEESSKIVIDTKNFYFGGGLGLNSLSGIEIDDGLGYQLFAGYVLPVNMSEAALSVEVGYMDSGNVDVNRRGRGSDEKAKGVWSTAVISFPLKDRFSVLARAGLDFGDDDGFMFGGGVGYQANKKIELRAEYVVRDNIDSLQFNALWRM